MFITFVTKECTKKTEIAMTTMFLFFTIILGKLQIEKKK